jgi:putative phosphoesterase
MLVGVLSDVHDHLENLQRALEEFRRRGIRTLVFCGDFCSPVPARTLATYPGEVHCVFGNGDGDRYRIQTYALTRAPNLKVHGEYAELDLGGARIAVTHYPLYGRALAMTGEYRAVFSGHTHEQHEERFGDCAWVNPGDVMGLEGAPSCAVYDTDQGTVEFVSL